MTQALTKEHLDQQFKKIDKRFDGVFVEVRKNTADIQHLTEIVRQNTADIQHLTEIVRQNTADIQHLTSQISTLTGSIDQYLKRTEDWYQEQMMLRTRLERLERTLIRKRILTEEELLA